MRICKYVLTDNPAKKVHNRAELIAMIETLKPRKPIFKGDFQILVNYSVTNYDSLKIHTETVY